jgi:quinol monooxygenase YgiN
VVARVKAKPDKIEEVKSVLLDLIEPTRKETGCITYELLQNRQDPTEFTFVEEWTSDGALEEHFLTGHFQNAGSKLADFVAEPPDIRTYAVVG